MNIALDKQSTTKAILNISIEKDDYQTEVDKKLREYGKKVQLKGFRPGKVPKSVIQRMYGKNVLLEEVNKLISESISKCVKEHKLLLVGTPQSIAEVEESNNWTNPNTLEFSFELGMASDFEVDLNTLQLTNHIIKVDDDIIDKTILDYRKRFGSEEQVESIEEEEDYITIKLHLESEEESSQDSITDKTEEEEKPSVEEVTEADEAPSVSLIEEFEEEKENDNEKDKEYLAAFTLEKVQEEWKSKIKGQKKGETLSLPLKEVFGENIEEKLVAQLTPEEWETALNDEVKFTIEQIDRTVLAEIDEEFFKRVMPNEEEKTEETFRIFIKKQIEDFYKSETSKALKLQAKKELIKHANITLPDEFLKKWLIKNNEGKYTPEQVEEQYPDYAEYVKWDLIVEKVSNAKMEEGENDNPLGSWITIEDVKEEALKSIFAQYGMPYQASLDGNISKEFEPLIQNYLSTDDGATYQKIYNQVSSNKVLEAAVAEAQKEEQEITIDEYKEIVKNFL